METNLTCHLTFTEAVVLLEFLLNESVSEQLRQSATSSTEIDAVESILETLSEYRRKLI